MALTLELPTELAEQLQTQAHQLGVAAGDIALDVLTVYLATSKLYQKAGRMKRSERSELQPLAAPAGKAKTAATIAILDAIAEGQYAGMGLSSAALRQERNAEIERDERLLQERLGTAPDQPLA